MSARLSPSTWGRTTSNGRVHLTSLLVSLNNCSTSNACRCFDFDSCSASLKRALARIPWSASSCFAMRHYSPFILVRQLAPNLRELCLWDVNPEFSHSVNVTTGAVRTRELQSLAIDGTPTGRKFLDWLLSPKLSLELTTFASLYLFNDCPSNMDLRLLHPLPTVRAPSLLPHFATS
jgi:hypothetical protein